MSSPLVVRLSRRSLLLVAGLPGAGKSTLLRTLRPDDDVRILDSDTQRTALRRALPTVPYRFYRPLVHLWHRLSVIGSAASAAPVVVVHLPATRPRTRAVVAWLAARTGRSAHLLWCTADPEEARRGQVARGRIVPTASFERHARAAAHAPPAEPGPGWTTVTTVDRAVAPAGLRLVTDECAAEPCVSACGSSVGSAAVPRRRSA